MSSAARKPVKATEEHPELAGDPVWQAFLDAPFSDEEETEEQRRAIEEARKGPFVSSDAISAEIAERCRRGE
jgi:hypothetical protein